jgi:hypothetical protein
MTITELADRYIAGEPGFWHFQIEIMWGREISGGMFHRKQDARPALIAKLVKFLDDPEAFLRPKSEKPRARRGRGHPKARGAEA